MYFHFYCNPFDVVLSFYLPSLIFHQVKSVLLIATMTILSLFCWISVSPENWQMLWQMIVILPTQRQTPSLVGATLFYQSQGSYFDLAGNIERVMMFSVEKPPLEWLRAMFVGVVRMHQSHRWKEWNPAASVQHSNYLPGNWSKVYKHTEKYDAGSFLFFQMTKIC